MKPTQNALEIVPGHGAVTRHVVLDVGQLTIEGERLQATSNPKRWLRPSTENTVVLTDELAESLSVLEVFQVAARSPYFDKHR
jgi:16S rRNA A1518/A1519 N6-dimethyltransferase RsmA/KsgA/DIM1 with predicted DNA glycosylase/AP lyase activity